MISDKARKCPKCGCPVEHKPADGEQPVVPVSPAKQQEIEIRTEDRYEIKPDDEEVRQNEINIEDTDEEEDGIGKKKIYIIIAAIVVVVALVVGIGIKCCSNGAGDNDMTADADSIEMVAMEESADSVSVEELDYSIRPDGVGSFLLGKPFNEYNTQTGKEIYYDTCNIRSNFVVMKDDSFEDISYSTYMTLNGDGRTVLVLYGGCSDDSPDVSSCTVKGIHVYSPSFYTETGIHVGTTAEELIAKHNATIELHRGEGGETVEAITFEIPGHENLIFVADMNKLIRNHGNRDFLCSWDAKNNCERPNFSENLENEVRKNCCVERIIVGEYYELTQIPTGAKTIVGGPKSTKDWIQGTWYYNAIGLGTSKLVFNGKKLTVYENGKVGYSGDYEVDGDRINYGKGFYINVDTHNRWLKFDDKSSTFYGKLVDDKYVYPNFTGFDLWDDVWDYFSTKKNFSRKNAAHVELKTIAIEDNNLIVEGNNVGQIGYNNNDPGNIRGNQIWFILRTQHRDYNLVGEAEDGKITCLYFEPSFGYGYDKMPRYTYYYPQVTNGEFSIAVTFTEGLKPKPNYIVRYYADN